MAGATGGQRAEQAARPGRLGNDPRPGQERPEPLMAADLPGPLQLVECPPDRDQADAGERGQLGVGGQQVPGGQPALGH
jgi:hypothetical protein